MMKEVTSEHLQRLVRPPSVSKANKHPCDGAATHHVLLLQASALRLAPVQWTLKGPS